MTSYWLSNERLFFKIQWVNGYFTCGANIGEKKVDNQLTCKQNKCGQPADSQAYIYIYAVGREFGPFSPLDVSGFFPVAFRPLFLVVSGHAFATCS